MKKLHPIQQDLIKLSETQDLSKLSLRDIAKLINLSENQPQRVKHHLDQLQKKKLIDLSNKYSDNIVKRFNYLKSQASLDLINIPVLGNVNCGEPTLLVTNESNGFIKVSTSLTRGRKKIFALKAYGNSMNRANINGLNIVGGDFILVDSSITSPRSGDYVVSIIDDAANAKRIFFEPKHKRIVLLSESDEELEPIVIHENDLRPYLVAGKIFNVIKTKF